MADNRNQWRILEVENGYIILDDHPGKMHMEGPKWVAQDIASLKALVGELAEGKSPFTYERKEEN